MRYILFLLCCCSLVAYSPATSAQSAGDTLAKHYLKLAKKYNGQGGYVGYLLKADSLAVLEKDIVTRGQANEKLAHHYYQTDADKCIKYFEQAGAFYLQAGKKVQLAFCTQNTAFACEEGKKDLPCALSYTQRALALWKELNDTMQQANLYKYLGLLQGKTKRFDEAKENIETAVRLFKAKNYEPGVAVSQFDLAQVYEQQQMYDSSLFWMHTAKAFWQSAKDSSRLFNINNATIRVALLANNIQLAAEIQKENAGMLSDGFYWKDKLDFYEYSRSFFDKKGDKISADEYRQKFDDYKRVLLKEGKQVG